MMQYIIKRIIGMIPTLILISMLVFLAIEIVPGDYVEVMRAQEGDSAGMSLHSDMELTDGQIELLKERYGLNMPLYVRYWKWFSRFVRGDLGVSWAHHNRPIVEILSGRLGLTILVSLCTTVFIYMVSFPIGIYSAVRQYSIGDNIVTFVSFIGLSIPNFLLALILIVISFYTFKQIPGGLFSAKFMEAPWSLPRVWDLLTHLWIPVVVLGTAGTASTVRILRANMLDEMGRQYVDTARAKGLKETKILLKYPLRIALNPFITGIGYILPSLIGGELIVSLVLNLPTTGPLLYDAVIKHDQFLAGGIVMILSGLLVIGNLIADLLLSWVDPRIRYE